MKIDGFEWDNANAVKNIMSHDTYPDEIEETFYNKYKLRKTRQGRYLLYGVTDAGQHLFVVFMIKRKKGQNLARVKSDKRPGYDPQGKALLPTNERPLWHEISEKFGTTWGNRDLIEVTIVSEWASKINHEVNPRLRGAQPLIKVPNKDSPSYSLSIEISKRDIIIH